MHIAVELNELKLTHYHADTRIVAGLAYLESLHLKDVLFDNTASPTFLGHLTSTMLRHLYRNTCGKDFPEGMGELEMRDVLATLFDRMTPPKVDRDELEAQIDHVLYELEADAKTGKQFKYVHGSLVPNVLDGGLFPLTTPPASAAVLAESAQLAPQRREVPAAATIPASAPKPQRTSAAGPRVPSGGARPIIWAHADKVWEEAGKPTLVSDVLVLRKRMMVELEEQGIKKSTSSTALGDWQKARLG